MLWYLMVCFIILYYTEAVPNIAFVYLCARAAYTIGIASQRWCVISHARALDHRDTISPRCAAADGDRNAERPNANKSLDLLRLVKRSIAAGRKNHCGW